MGILQDYWRAKATEINKIGPRVLLLADPGIGGRPAFAIAAEWALKVTVVTVPLLHRQWLEEFRRETGRCDETVELYTIHSARKALDHLAGELLVVELGNAGPQTLETLSALIDRFSCCWVRDLRLTPRVAQMLLAKGFKLVTMPYNDVTKEG